MTDGSTVFIDIETGGIEPSRPIIQVAAVVVAPDWSELETLEVKIKFDVASADPQALAVNHYTAEAWRDAVPERAAVAQLEALLDRHRTVELISARTGRPYTVARVAGHNIIGFDLQRLAAMFKRHDRFFAVHFAGALDTLALAAWALLDEPKQPVNYKLTTLASHFGVSVDGAHDALVDVRLSIAIARKLRALNGGH